MDKVGLIRVLEEDGELLQEYPTDSWGGSNTGDGAVYKYEGKYYEVDRKRDSDKVRVGELKDFEEE